MGANEVLLGYQARLAKLDADASQLRFAQLIAVVVMSFAVVAILATLWLSVARRTGHVLYSLLPAPLIIVSGRAYRKRRSALLQSLHLQAYYEQGVARLEGRWAGSGIKGEEFLHAGHVYDRDLNLFGEGSLFELLCTCRTQVGRRQLAEYMVAEPNLQNALERQAAVQELKNRSDLREQMNLLGEFSFQDSSWNTIADWVKSPALCAPSYLRVLALVTSISLAMLLLLGFDSVFAWRSLVPCIGLVLLIHGALGLRYRTRLLASLPAINSVDSELGVLREGLHLLRCQQFNSPLLNRLAESSRRLHAPAAIGKLQRLIGALTERNKEWFYAVSRALLVGTQVFWAIEEWRSRYSEALLTWLSAWGQFEALAALSCYAYEHPDHAFPSFLEGEVALEGKAIGHPLLSPHTCVRNDMSLNGHRRFYVISGSNMAGKSTFIRAVGLNAILAYSGSPVCAEAMSLSLLSICASISIQDSLLNGRSKFLAEIDRLKHTLNLTKGNKPVLFLIDEPLSGTNSRDRRIAAESIVRTLVQSGAIGIISTHDLALTEIASIPDLRGTNVHMGSRDSFEPMNFDFKIKPGVTEESNALAIARLAGVCV